MHWPAVLSCIDDLDSDDNEKVTAGINFALDKYPEWKSSVRPTALPGTIDDKIAVNMSIREVLRSGSIIFVFEVIKFFNKTFYQDKFAASKAGR